MAASLLCLAAAPLGCTSKDAPPRPAHGAPTGPVERVYLGVSCPQANSIRCDEVGLYVWLRRPARGVTARLAGQRLPLRKRAAPSIKPGTHWEGFLDNAGLDGGPIAVAANDRGRWFGEPDVWVRVQLTLQLTEHPDLTRTLSTPLRAGYG